jgi:hypothetical protein
VAAANMTLERIIAAEPRLRRQVESYFTGEQGRRRAMSPDVIKAIYDFGRKHRMLPG